MNGATTASESSVVPGGSPKRSSEVSDQLGKKMKRHHLDVSHARRAFDECKPSTYAGLAASVTAGAASDAEMLDRLVEAAIDGEFLEHFLLGLSYWAARSGIEQNAAREILDLWKRSEPETKQAVQLSVNGAGLMEAVLNTERGQTPIETIYDIVGSSASIGCLVEGNGQTVGTAFLVADDVVLTNAHVVSMFAAVKGGRREEVPGEVTVLFPNTRFMKGSQSPIRVPLHKQWLVWQSSPLGSPPHMAIADTAAVKADAMTRLDCAFLRLATQPSGLVPLDVRKPPAPLKTGLNHVIGFPNGGRACVYDAAPEQRYIKDAARVEHTMNTSHGMSGSPCLDSQARIYALHEGSVKNTVGESVYNRAIAMECIIAALPGGPEMLAPRIGRLWLDNPEVRRAWARAGLRLAGEPWLERLQKVGDPHPEAVAERSGFHPLFTRSDVDKWVQEAAASDSIKRFLRIGGLPGAGKSFCRHTVQAALPDRGHEFVYLPSDAAVNADRLAINQALRQATKIVTNVGGAGVRVRPMSGSLTLDEIEPLVQALTGAVAATGRLLWLYVDFGRGEGWAGETEAFWRAFAIRAASEPSLRLIFAGIRATTALDLGRAMPGVESIDLKALDVTALQSYLDLLVPARRIDLTTGSPAVAPIIADLLDVYEATLNGHAPGTAMIQAAFSVIVLVNLLGQPPADLP